MNHNLEMKENERLSAARESFSGRLLTNAQFDEAVAISGILKREIRKSGAFKDKLGDYAFAYSRTEKMDAVKADTVLRDLFREITGQSMNEMREALAEREEKLNPQEKGLAIEYALGVGTMIEEGDKIAFHRAFAHQAQLLAERLGITDAGAKRLMKEAFQTQRNEDFYEWGKSLEELFYRPQIDAEKRKSDASADHTRSSQVTTIRSRPAQAKRFG